ncbi:hypothetical protein THRCLA_11136 [Thraustotheca clavata]|uniref:Uncharacterized protein n=1 Tax=Thraustotheca clavata TaxID=74557 RepID=A0A1V9Y8U0_9STRA|nr:hypothetical protein THRCLA_11136 [Thraustotheca clavata]
MDQVCARQSAKLEELMNFLSFAVLQDCYKGVVVFSFLNEARQVVSVRTVDTTTKIRIYASRPPPQTSCVDIALTIVDFLQMYSGELTAAEIAGLCMSGKVQVRWTAYSSVKAFADSFDFSPEKWTEFYDHFGLDPNYVDGIECTMSCCAARESCTQEDIDLNWQLIKDSILVPSGDMDWQLVSQMEITTVVPSPKDAKVDEDIQWIDTIHPHFLQMQETVKKKMFNMKEYAEKFLALRLAHEKLSLNHAEITYLDLDIAELYLEQSLAHPNDSSLSAFALEYAQKIPESPLDIENGQLPFEPLEWQPRRLRCAWMLLKLQKASIVACISPLCQGILTCETNSELREWGEWFIDTLQDQLEDMHTALIDQSITSSSYGEVASHAYAAAAKTTNKKFKLWLLETLCHSFLVADNLMMNSAKKMFDFCDQFSTEVGDDQLRCYFILLRLLLCIRMGDIVKAQEIQDSFPDNTESAMDTYWLNYRNFLHFKIKSYYDPNQCLTISPLQMQCWPPYLAEATTYLRYSALTVFEIYEITCYLLDTQGRFNEMAELATRMLEMCQTYRHIFTTTPLVISRMHVTLARYSHSMNAMEAAVTHVNSAFSLLLAETQSWPNQSDASLNVLMEILDVATTIVVSPLPSINDNIIDLCEDEPTAFYPTEYLLEFAAGILQDKGLRDVIYNGPSKEFRAKYDLYLAKWFWASNELGMTGSYPELDSLRSYALSILQDCLELSSTSINCSNTTASIMALFGPKLENFGKADEGERTLTNALKVAMHTRNIRLQLQIMAEIHASCARKVQVKAQAIVAEKYRKKLESLARKVARALENDVVHRRLLKWTLPKAKQ